MRRLLLALIGLLCAPLLAAQVIGVQPTPIGLYQWDSTTTQWDKLPNSYSLFPSQNTPQPFAFYGWNSAIGQWVPCDVVTASCPIGSGGGSPQVYPAGTGVPQVVSGTSWGTTLGTQGTGSVVLAGSGAAANKYIDGGSYSWTFLPFQTLTTNGSSGPSTLIAGVLNVPIYTGNGSSQCSLGIAGLAGAFTDGSGIVKSAVCLGNGPTSVTVPPGATQLQVGINDNYYSDNLGAFVISVSKNGTAAIPVTVGGTVMPWDSSTNPGFAYGSNNGIAPVVALTGLVAGDVITTTWVSGTVAYGGSTGSFDANGFLTVPPGPAGGGGPTGSFSNSFGFFPTKYMTPAFDTGAITQLTGDATALGPGSVAITFKTVNSGPGTCGDATHVCQVTTNGKGLVTNQSQVLITGTGGSSAWSALTNPLGNLALTMGAFTTALTYNSATGSSDLFKLTDTAGNTGTGILFHLTTASGSALTPWQVDANGVGWKIDTLGRLVGVGSSTTHGAVIPEGTPISGVALNTVLTADSTTHRLLENPNNIGALVIPGTSTTPATAAHCIRYAANGYDIEDAGASCGAGTGTVSDSSGTTTTPQVALSTTTVHQIQYSSALPNGITATTQSANDNSTKVATTAYVDGRIRQWSCEPGLGDGANAISAATYLQSTCYNTTGSTITLNAIKCFTDNSGTSTVNATNGAGTGLLTGAITCSSTFAAGTQSGTTTIANGDYIKFTFVADGTSKQSTWVVGGTY